MGPDSSKGSEGLALRRAFFSAMPRKCLVCLAVCTVEIGDRIPYKIPAALKQNVSKPGLYPSNMQSSCWEVMGSFQFCWKYAPRRAYPEVPAFYVTQRTDSATRAGCSISWTARGCLGCAEGHGARDLRGGAGDELWAQARLRTVAQFRYAFLFRTMITAEHYAVLLQAVAYDPHTAMRANGREHLDRTFEAIESIGFVRGDYLKRFVVFIPASIAFWHKFLLCWLDPR